MGGRVTIIIIAVAAVAIVAVVVSSGGIDLGGGGEPAERGSAGGGEAGSEDDEAPGEEPEKPEEPEEPEEPEPAERELPENPDDVRGSDPFALTRTVNFRRVLAVLEARRRRVEGVFDGLRLAPGRIDTIIIHPDDRRTNIQVRPDFRISFESTHDFPTQAGFRETGLSARMVDVRAPARILRAIDRIRRGSAARDVDYLVIGRHIIDRGVDVSAFMRIRTPRPRAFLKEPDAELRAIG